MAFLKLNPGYKSFIKYWKSPIKNQEHQMVFSLLWSLWKFETEILVGPNFSGKKYEPILLKIMARMKRGNTLKLFDTFDQQLWKFSNLKIIA